MMKWILALFVLVVSISAAAADPLIVLVRHAEKTTGDGDDPSLTAAGQRRAEMLAAILKDSGITAVFTSEFKRTKETAAPTAKALGVSATVVRGNEPDELVARLRQVNGNALVVGHANSIPAVLKALGVESAVNIGENDYTDILVVALGAQPQLLHLHYPPALQ